MNGAGRFAPSPTGELHLGNLRTAVLAWLFARTTGRAFLLRVEDLDPQRSDQALARQQLADLESLGIDFDDTPVAQSSRLEQYAAALERLDGQTYPCFCTRREIAEAVAAPQAIGGAPIGLAPDRPYPGTCRDLSPVERKARIATGRSPALRLRADGARQSITDALHGAYTGQVDDFVLRRNDGVPAYNVAVVVDDGQMGIDQVVRGDDLLSSSPRQAYLAGLLGLPMPTYAHVPLAINEQGVRLAKRDGAVTLGDLAPAGIGAREVLSLLASSLGLAAPEEPVTLATLLDRFDPATLPRDPWVVRQSPPAH